MDLERINAFGEVQELDNSKILTNIELEKLNLCLKIRSLASNKNLKLDESVHRVKYNKYIIDFIRAVGLEPLDFIRDYLRNLQPFMVEREIRVRK